jgi:3-oxoacyl-[acyl-carrier protein] reductase
MNSNKTIIITGISRGLGKSLLLEALKHEHLNVIGISRNTQLVKNEFVNSVRKPYLIDFNLSDEREDYTRLVQLIIKEFGTVDYLINNAATINVKPFMEFTSNEIENLYKINVFSVLKLIREISPLMQNKQTRSHIVNISSMGGYQGSIKFPGLSIYASTKAAIANLTEGLAVEFAEKNISINCLAIGAVQTEMLKSAFPDYNGGVKPETMADYVLNFTIRAHQVFNGKILPVSNSTP